MQRVVRVFNAIHIATVYLAKVLLVAMTLIIAVHVFMRYVLRSGIHQSEELALLFAVWFIFIAMSIGVKQNLHISINILPPNTNPKVNHILSKLKDVVVIGISVVMFIYGIRLVQFTMRSIMPATRLPSGILYMVLPVAAVLMCFDSVMDLLGVDTHDADVDRALGGAEVIDE